MEALCLPPPESSPYSILYLVNFILFIFLSCFRWHVAHRISVPQPGIESVPSVMEARSFSQWITREDPLLKNLTILLKYDCHESESVSCSVVSDSLQLHGL